MTRRLTRHMGRSTTAAAAAARCGRCSLDLPLLCLALLLLLLLLLHCAAQAAADRAAPTTGEAFTSLDTPRDDAIAPAFAHDEASASPTSPKHKVLPPCQAPGSGAATPAAPAAGAPMSLHCALPHISADIARGPQHDLLRRADTPEVQRCALVWQLGPRTTAQQAPLHSSFATYFRNLSTVDTDSAARPLRGNLGLLRLSRRIRAYHTAHLGTVGPTLAGGTAGTSRRRRRRRSSWIPPRVDPLLNAVQPVTRAVFAAFNAGDLVHSAWLAIADVKANLRDFAWWSPTAWRRLYSRQTVVVRFRVAAWAREGRAEEDSWAAEAAADDVVADADVTDGAGADGAAGRTRTASRQELAAHAALSLLRIVSFPAVAELRTAAPVDRAGETTGVVSHTNLSTPSSSSVAFVCKLAEVDAAAQVVAREFAGMSQNRAAAAGQRSYAAGSSAVVSPIAVLSFLFQALRSLLQPMRFIRGPSDVSARRPASPLQSAEGATSTASIAAALEFTHRTREELGPFQPFGDSVLPVVLQELLSSRPVHTRLRLLETHANAAPSETTARSAAAAARVEFTAEWTASLPASTPVCLALIALPPTSATSSWSASPQVSSDAGDENTSADKALPLWLSESSSLDVLWVQLMALTWVLWQLERRVAQSAVVRHAVTGLTGVVVLLVVLLFYAVRHVQKMAVGQVLMLLVALLMCGSVASMEGIVMRVWNSYLLDVVFAADTWGHDGASGGVSFPAGPILMATAVLLFLCVVSGSLLHWLLPPAMLRTITRWCVRGLLVQLWWLCVQRNVEATVATVVLWAVWPPRVLRFASSRVAWLTTLAARRRTSMAASPAAAAAPAAPSASLNDPLDDLPPAARQARAYVRPLATSLSAGAGPHRSGHSYAGLGSAEARFRQYDEDGAAHTRRALEALAAHLRSNPGRYAARLRDPNGLQRWAGAANDDVDAMDAE